MVFRKFKIFLRELKIVFFFKRFVFGSECEVWFYTNNSLKKKILKLQRTVAHSQTN